MGGRVERRDLRRAGSGGVGVEVFLEEEVGDGSRFCPGMTGEGCAGEAFFTQRESTSAYHVRRRGGTALGLSASRLRIHRMMGEFVCF